MSLFTTLSLTCRACEAAFDFEAVGSVNADRRPDLRDQIVGSSFQTTTCPSCAEAMRLEPEFNYLDVELGLWIAAYPPRLIDDYLLLEDAVQTLFDESYGKGSTPAAQGVGETLATRLTFGWPALREKIVLHQNKLNDVSVEMLKLDLLRRLPEAPLGLGVELRVADVSEDQLAFVFVETSSEAILQEFSASRLLLQEVEDNPDGWAAIRASLTNGMFVDTQKLYLGEGRDVA